MKFKVHSLEHAKAINKRAQELGYEPLRERSLKNAKYLYIEENFVKWGDKKVDFENSEEEEVTLDKLYEPMPALTTFDGVNIYEPNQKVYFISDNSTICSVNPKVFKNLNHLLFSTEKAAEEYLREKKERDLREEAQKFVDNLTDDKDHTVVDVIVNFVKHLNETDNKNTTDNNTNRSSRNNHITNI